MAGSDKELATTINDMSTSENLRFPSCSQQTIHNNWEIFS